MFRGSIAVKPSPFGWSSMSLPNSWKRPPLPCQLSQRLPCRQFQHAKHRPLRLAHKKQQRIETERCGSVAGRGCAHVTPGIDRRVVHAHFVVDMRAGGAAADTGVADNLAALCTRARNRRERRQVCIPGGDTKSVIDYHQAAVPCMVFRDGNDSVSSSVNGSAVIRSDVYAGMKRALTAEWIQAFAKAVGDMT